MTNVTITFGYFRIDLINRRPGLMDLPLKMNDDDEIFIGEL